MIDNHPEVAGKTALGPWPSQMRNNQVAARIFGVRTEPKIEGQLQGDTMVTSPEWIIYIFQYNNNNK